eukprot:IDg20205t1
MRFGRIAMRTAKPYVPDQSICGNGRAGNTITSAVGSTVVGHPGKRMRWPCQHARL